MLNKAKLILHPVRMRIMLALTNQQLTPLQLSEKFTDVSQATVYRQLNQLFDAKLLRVVQENQVRGTTEKVYTAIDGAALLSPSDFMNASPEDHMRYFTVFVSTLLADFSRYLENGEPDMIADMVGYRQASLNLTDDELMDVTNKINAVLLPHLANKADGTRRRRILTTILLPDTSAPPDTPPDSAPDDAPSGKADRP